MSVLDRPVADTASVLERDPELRDAVAAEQRALATRCAQARVVRVPRGQWDARTQAERARGGYGLLIFDGLLVRQVGYGDHIGAELLGPGDLLRPHEHDGEGATLAFAAGWRVLEALRLAVLDRRWAIRMHRFPDVGVALTGRAMLRARRLANTLVIASHPRLDARLHLLLWELADRYGTVRPAGVHVGVPLTHELLSELAAARRPSVSAALRRLAEDGLVERVADGWLLHGAPPVQT